MDAQQANPAKQESVRASGTKPPAEQFKERESKELVLGFSGPVGCAVGTVINEAQRALEEFGYSVRRIKLSDYICRIAKEHDLTDRGLSSLIKYERYDRLQTAGDNIRKTLGNEILAEVAVSDIAVHRTTAAKEKGVTIDEYVPERTAYIIDQLKNPAEVLLLRTVYRDIFYLVGVLASQGHRKKNLNEEGLSDIEAEKIMDRDKKENFEHGQQLDKTLKLADFFVRNTHSNRQIIESQINRFIKLIHGENGITPTQHEHAMYIAFSAALQSACLSRQVGACIADAKGNILSTGCNDVPRAGGGLYQPAHQPNDNRCVNLQDGKCFNDDHKLRLAQDIASILQKHGIETKNANMVAEEIKKNTRLKDLIEFSRSVHAEMAAITALARVGGVAVQDAHLYTTTFPCHNCARHIVAAGISHVYYIEPYEKSLALELHDDAIDVDMDLDGGDTARKVHFLHFEGVAPRQYQNLFFAADERKDERGLAKRVPASNRAQVVPEYLDSYRDFEKKVVTHCKEIGISGDVFCRPDGD